MWRSVSHEAAVDSYSKAVIVTADEPGFKTAEAWWTDIASAANIETEVAVGGGAVWVTTLCG